MATTGPGEAASWDSPGEPESVEIEKILTEKATTSAAWSPISMICKEHVEEAALEAHIGGERNCSAMKPPSPAAKWRGRPHESLRLSRLIAVVIATAITAFIVACWSLLADCDAIIALLFGSACIHMERK